MDQQTWVITFNGDTEEVGYQADILKDLLLNISADINVTQKPESEYTQGWVGYLIIKLKATKDAVKQLTNTISTLFQSTHGASINIEIKDGELAKVEMKNITSGNCDKALHDILEYLKSN